MKRILWTLFFICLVVDIILATFTWQEVRDIIGWVKNIPQKTDFKLRHFIQYSPQAVLLGFCLEQFKFNLNKRALLSIIIITSIGCLTEFIQIFIPSRIPALMDVFWNFSAAVFGSFIYYMIKKIYPRLKSKT